MTVADPIPPVGVRSTETMTASGMYGLRFDHI